MSAVMAVQHASAVSTRVSRAVTSGLAEAETSPQVPLLGRVAPEWKVIQPLLITLERDTDGSILASEEVFCMYGIGQDVVGAIEAYIDALVEYYQLLSAHNDEPTRALFTALQNYLQPISR